MTDPESPALREAEPQQPDSGGYDPDASPFPEPEIEWIEPGVDVWSFIKRIVTGRWKAREEA